MTLLLICLHQYRILECGMKFRRHFIASQCHTMELAVYDDGTRRIERTNRMMLFFRGGPTGTVREKRVSNWWQYNVCEQ